LSATGGPMRRCMFTSAWATGCGTRRGSFSREHILRSSRAPPKRPPKIDAPLADACWIDRMWPVTEAECLAWSAYLKLPQPAWQAARGMFRRAFEGNHPRDEPSAVPYRSSCRRRLAGLGARGGARGAGEGERVLPEVGSEYSLRMLATAGAGYQLPNSRVPMG
jgi:hypothetical protein